MRITKFAGLIIYLFLLLILKKPKLHGYYHVKYSEKNLTKYPDYHITMDYKVEFDTKYIGFEP